MDKKFIYKIQKNRPPYLFVDKITKLIPQKICNSYLKLHKSKWFFKVHWPGDPNMPAFLQLEAMTQTCAIALLSRKKNKSKFIYVMSVDKVKFYKKVLPGDTLIIETTIEKIKMGVANCKGKCKVGNKTVSMAQFNLLIPEKFMRS